MYICKKCKKEFGHDWRKDPRNEPKYCSVSCSNSRVRSMELRRRLSIINRKYEPKYCSCGTKLSHNNSSGVCRRCRPKMSNTENTRKYRRSRKMRMVQYKGGKCVICGYHKSVKALHFHHIDSTKKKFNVSSPQNVSWARVKRELDKCILVCANCHAEIHDNTCLTEYVT